MELQEWKDSIIKDAKVQIYFRNNLSLEEDSNLVSILSIYLEDGINIIKQWRKLKNDNEFIGGIHNVALKRYIADRYLAAGRELFNDYSSGGVKATMKQSPESRLKSCVKQVI